jgi:predicted transcriptional regulator
MDDHRPDTPIALALPHPIGDSLADVARYEGRTPEAVALDAIAEHCAAMLEMRAKILRGEADVAAGRIASHEEVMADLNAIVAAARRPGSA